MIDPDALGEKQGLSPVCGWKNSSGRDGIVLLSMKAFHFVRESTLTSHFDFKIIEKPKVKDTG